MKKTTNLFLAILMTITVLAVPQQQTYAAASLSMSVSSSNVNIGDTVSATVTIPSGYSATVDVSFPTNLLSYQGASTEQINGSNAGGGHLTVNLTSAMNLTSVTFKFKALTSGSATISANVLTAGDDNTGDQIQMSGASRTVSIANQAVEQPQETKSADNSLKVLKLSNGKLSPSFKKGTTKYTATVDYSVKSVAVTATPTHEKAVVESVTGHENLKVGENTIEIVVRAENGVKATYKIVVTRKAEETTAPETPNTELPPETEQPQTIIKWNGEDLYVSNQIPQEVIPADFAESVLVVNGAETPCLTFKNTDVHLLYLVNPTGNGSFYLYNMENETISPFVKLENANRYVIVVEPKNDKIPEGYYTCSLSIEGKGVVTACQLNTEELSEEVHSTQTSGIFGQETFYAAEPVPSDFYLIYCVNNDGEYGWYQYDAIEGTFQRYLELSATEEMLEDTENTRLPSDYQKLEAELTTTKMLSYILLAVAAVFAIAFIVVLVLLLKKRHRKTEDFYDYEDTENYESTEISFEDAEAYESTEAYEPTGSHEDAEAYKATEAHVGEDHAENYASKKADELEKLADNIIEEVEEDYKKGFVEDDDLEFLDL